MVDARQELPAHDVAVVADGAGFLLDRNGDEVPGWRSRARGAPALDFAVEPQTDRAALVEPDLAKRPRGWLSRADIPPAGDITCAFDRAGGTALRGDRHEGPSPGLGSAVVTDPHAPAAAGDAKREECCEPVRRGHW